MARNRLSAAAGGRGVCITQQFGRHLLFVDATGSQYEGYQYLGAGLLLLGAICFITMFFSTRVYFARRHFGLACACLVFTALALSNVVYFGTHKIIDLEPVPSFMNQLRSSGRVFWPVTYVLLVGCVATTARLVPGLAGSAVLLITALMQLGDAHDLRHRTAHDLRARYPMAIDEARLDALMSAHTRLNLVPTYGCGADANAPEFLEILLAASMRKLAANTMYVGRFETLPNCRTTSIAEAPLAPGELRVFLSLMAHSGPALVPGNAEHCRSLGPVAICTLQTRLLAELPVVKPPTLTIGANLPTGALAASSALGSGWYTPEPEGVWSVDSSATIVSELSPQPGSDIVLSAKLQGFTGKIGTFQRVNVSVNGHTPTAFDIPDRRPYELRLNIPHDQFVAGTQILRFDIAHPERPSALHQNGDTRQLGIFLSQLRFDPVGGTPR